MKIPSNARQIPAKALYTAEKKYNDVMYGYLQSISYTGNTSEYERYIDSDFSFQELGDAVGISRQTASPEFKRLQSLGLVGEKDRGKYELYLIDTMAATLVDIDVLNSLLEYKKPRVISMYAILFKRYYAAKMAGRPYLDFTMPSLKTAIGLSTNTTSNSNIVEECFDILIELELVEYEQVRFTRDTPGVYITENRIYSMSNRV